MELVLASIIAFASTNIDDIFILMVFFSNKEYSIKAVVAGQYLGIIVLIAVSYIGSLLGLLIDQQYLGLLGFMPVFFGARSLIRLFKQKHNKEQEEEKVVVKKTNKTLSIAALTIANGGDNIGIYIPLFATLSIGEGVLMIFIFLLMVSIWCLLAIYLSKHPAIANTIGKYGHIISPVVLIALGIYILYESGSFNLFAESLKR